MTARCSMKAADDIHAAPPLRRPYDRCMFRLPSAGVLLFSFLAAISATAETIPKTTLAPTLDDFLTMKPSPRIAGSMARFDSFIQREPNNGQPATERTEAYVAYDADNFYAVFVCFDREPSRIRGHMTRREN